MVSIKVEWEVVCALSNGDIAHNLQCPLTAPNYPFSAFSTAIYSVVTGEPRDVKFTIASPTLPMKNIPRKGRGQGQANRFRILHPV